MHENTKKRIEEVLNAQKRGEQDAAEKIAALNAEAGKHKAEMEKASALGDADGFISAREKHDKLVQKIQVLKDFSAQKREQPAITKAEYVQLVARVTGEQETSVTEAKKEILAIINELKKIGSRIADEVTETNSLLSQLQIDIYKNADRKNAFKTKEYMEMYNKKEFSDNSVQLFVRDVINRIPNSWKKVDEEANANE